jgi:predicted transcriptional regulator of viral defense system
MNGYTNLGKDRKNDVLHHLEDEETVIFSVKEMYKDFRDRMNYVEFCKVLSKLNRIGHIERIGRGKYIKRGFKDQNVIGNYITEDAVIAYWSALNLHGLTEQFPNMVFVQTTKKKQNITIFGVEYKIITVKPEELLGVQHLGFGNHAFRITDKEKTIVDCFDLPEYSGDFHWVVEAFKNNRWNQDLLIKYTHAVGNDAATKRMGYLADICRLPMSRFIRFAKGRVNHTVNLLNPLTSNTGSILTKWGLKVNDNWL